MLKEAVSKKPTGFSCRTIELENLNTTEAAPGPCLCWDEASVVEEGASSDISKGLLDLLELLSSNSYKQQKELGLE